MNELARQRLMDRIGHDFRRPEFFHTALTHRSRGADNNERLEFLGDSLLNTIIAEALYQRFPRAKEGQLSRLRAHLVKGETLAEIAREFDLGECLYLGEGEMKSGGFRRASILADTVEALVAAIYLDSDFDHCRGRVLDWFASRLESLSLSATKKDPKSELQEFLQARGLPLPVYQVIATTGEAHKQVFTVSCEVSLLNQPVVTTASSRREGEKLAARQALALLANRSSRP